MYQTSITYGILPYPEAYITKGKNRLRQNGTNVYLSDNDEFEIELFNPKLTNVLAKIRLNGNYISSRGLVIKPGQRVYLDRFIDDTKKFKFTTYEVDGSNAAAKAAIALNGNVDIEFYDEPVSSSTVVYNTYTTFDFNTPISPTPGIFYTNSVDLNNNLSYSGGLTANGTPLYSYSMSNASSGYNNNGHLNTSSAGVRSQNIETGRVEKGGNSDTKLQNVNMDFNTYASHWVSWKIQPQSQQPVEAGDIKNYCTSCGFRIRKDTWQFCPKCGNKLK